MSAAIFWVCALGAVVTGVAVFRVDSMARATFALLASFVFAAVPLLLLLGLPYLGVLVILMMIMEMVVMAIFMIRKPRRRHASMLSRAGQGHGRCRGSQPLAEASVPHPPSGVHPST